MKALEEKGHANKKANAGAGVDKHPEIKIEGPLSEKDEFKKAEERTRKALKHHL